MTEKDVGKVSYMLNLLGKANLADPSLDDEYEDILTEPMEQKMNLIKGMKGSFIPSISVTTDDYESATTVSQDETEISILEAYKANPLPKFLYKKHITYILNSLNRQLPSYFDVLDANHPWMTYWLYNSFHLIKKDDVENTFMDIDMVKLLNDKIESCIIDDGQGGIAGGTNQLGHVAATYAAVLTLVSSRNYDLLERIRPSLYCWLMSLKLADGSFRMHEHGESDARSTYCVLVIASLLNVVSPELTEGTLAWLNKTQTYEGGFGGSAGTEAHGGYSYCAFASYFILFDTVEEIKNCGLNLDSLSRWAVMRQFQLEGGLSGRTNKLVDACYSFWVGAMYSLLESIVDDDIFDHEGLRNYILRCSQAESGGFRDKPGKSVDFYHTNYTLCGLSVCEYKVSVGKVASPLAYNLHSTPRTEEIYTTPVNPVFGIPSEIVHACKVHFQSLDL